MRNPFDQNFFKFLLGFTLILAASFALLFFIGQYSSVLDSQKALIIEGK